jgi:hypothetical protein
VTGSAGGGALAARDSVNQPVRDQRILDCGALPQELRVPAEQHVRASGQDCAKRLHCAHRHRGFTHDGGAFGQVRQEALRGAHQIGKIGGVRGLGLRGTHAEEVHLSIRGSSEIGSEHQPARGAPVLEEFVKAGFVEGCHRLVELFNLGGIDVDTHHGVAHRSKRCSVNCAEVAAADHGDLHEEGPLLEVNSLGPTPAGAPAMTSL